MSVDREAIRTRWSPGVGTYMLDGAGNKIRPFDFHSQCRADIAALLAALEEAEVEIERQHLYRGALRVDLTQAEAERDTARENQALITDGCDYWRRDALALRAHLDTAKGHILDVCDKHDALFRGDNNPTEEGAYAMLAAVLDARAFLADGPNP